MVTNYKEQGGGPGWVKNPENPDYYQYLPGIERIKNNLNLGTIDDIPSMKRQVELIEESESYRSNVAWGDESELPLEKELRETKEMLKKRIAELESK